MHNRYSNIGEYFYEIVSNNKNNAALCYEDKIITYQELNELSNKIANYFLSSGIKSNDVVGILNTKDVLGYASMFACLKIGAIYTNIDEENPSKRLEKILNVCKPKLLVSDHAPYESIINTTQNMNIDLINMKSNTLYLEQDDENLKLTQNIPSSNPAYIMFTSGSTGTPKGVLISHANILSFLQWSIDRYEITHKDRFLQVSPIYFDNSVFDFYTALFSGASLVPVSKEISKNPFELVKLCDRMKCSIWFSVPSLFVYLLSMRVLNKENLKYIRVFTFGGEGFPKGELKKLYSLYSDRAKFVNVYGPTEATCICSSYDITPKEFDDMNSLASLGRINKNFNYIIVDKEMKEVESNMKGELCLIGSNVGLGYYNDKNRTKESFIQNRSNIMYKTGDIVIRRMLCYTLVDELIIR